METSDYLETLNQFLLNNGVFKRLEPLDNLFAEKTRLALDIGTHSLKLVEVRDTPKGPSLVSMGHEVIQYTAGASAEEKRRHVAQALGDLVLQNKVKTRRVHVIISEPDIYLRHINIPIVPENELARAIRWQAEKYIPFPIDEAIVDFQILSSKVRGSENQMEIVIVALPQKLIEQYIELVKEVKLIPAVIDAAPFAVAKAFRHNYEIQADEIIPVIDIGAHTTSVVIVKRDSIQLVRNFNVAGQQLTDVIAKDRSITRDKAEEMKKNFCFSRSTFDREDDVSIASLMKPVIVEWAEQVNRSLAYCEKELIQDNVQQVYLCGGGATMTGLNKILADMLKISVKVADPFKKVHIPEKFIKTPEVLKIAPAYMAALGEVI